MAAIPTISDDGGHGGGFAPPGEPQPAATLPPDASRSVLRGPRDSHAGKSPGCRGLFGNGDSGKSVNLCIL